MRYVPPRCLQTEIVHVDLVGVGGTGSLLLTELARLHVTLRGCGHPHGLHVTVLDPDLVTEANIGRTAFAPSHIGEHKASVLITSLNHTFPGLNWDAFPVGYQVGYWNPRRMGAAPHILITAVDTLRTRAEIYRGMLLGNSAPPRLWLDCGNDVHTGQVVLGEPEWAGDALPDRPRRRLPTVVDVFPDMLDRAEVEEEEPGSCSLMGALDRQSLTINRWVSTAAFELLYQLFFQAGGLEAHGAFLNARSLRVNPILVDPSAAARLAAPPVALDSLPETAARPVRPARRRLRAVPV